MAYDRMVSFIGLLFLWPILLIVAILVKVKILAVFNYRKGVWHTVEVIEATVIYEAMDGKYGDDGSEGYETPSLL